MKRIETLCLVVFLLAATFATVLGDYNNNIAVDTRETTVFADDGDCPFDCNSGVCNTTTLHCDCDEGFIGDNCNVTLISYQTVYEARFSSGDAYIEYAVDFFVGNQLRVSINVTDDNPTLLEYDLLLKLGGLPSYDNYDLRYDSMDIDSMGILDVYNVTHGRWFFAFIARDNYVRFYFSVTNATSCPNNCSGRGECDPKTYQCLCNSPWQGNTCSQAFYDLSNGQTTSGTVNSGEWIYYKYTIDPSIAASIVAYRFILSRNSNVYSPWFVMNFDSIPDLDNAFMEWTNGANITSDFFIIPNHLSYQEFYIAIFGNVKQSNYSITFVLDEGCPSDCSNHGQCIYEQNLYAHCQCDPGYSNPNCNERNNTLVLGTGVTGELTGSTWDYYFIDVPAENKTVLLNFLLTRETSKNKGVPLLFVQQNTKPTITSYEKQEIALQNEATVSVMAHAGERWYIGLTLQGSVGISEYMVTITATEASSEGWASFGIILGLLVGVVVLFLGLLYALRWYKRRSRTTYEPLAIEDEELDEI